MLPNLPNGLSPIFATASLIIGFSKPLTFAFAPKFLNNLIKCCDAFFGNLPAIFLFPTCAVLLCGISPFIGTAIFCTITCSKSLSAFSIVFPFMNLHIAALYFVDIGRFLDRIIASVFFTTGRVSFFLSSCFFSSSFSSDFVSLCVPILVSVLTCGSNFLSFNNSSFMPVFSVSLFKLPFNSASAVFFSSDFSSSCFFIFSLPILFLSFVFTSFSCSNTSTSMRNFASSKRKFSEPMA